MRSWVVVLDEDRDDPGRIVVEVYDHAQPPAGLQIPPVEALTPGTRVVLAVIRCLDGCEDRVDVVEQPVATPEGHNVEYDAAGQVAGMTLVNVRWLLDRDGELVITWPAGHVQASELAPVLASAA